MFFKQNIGIKEASAFIEIAEIFIRNLPLQFCNCFIHP